MTGSRANLTDNGSIGLAEFVPVRELQGGAESATAAVVGNAVGQDEIGEEAVKITLGDWKT